MDPLTSMRASFEHPLYLIGWVSGATEPLMEQQIQVVNKRHDMWDCNTDELWTPRSLPLRIQLLIGVRSRLSIYSAGTRIFEWSPVDPSFHMDLWLSTDEVLTLSTERRRDYAKR